MDLTSYHLQTGSADHDSTPIVRRSPPHPMQRITTWSQGTARLRHSTGVTTSPLAGERTAEKTKDWSSTSLLHKLCRCTDHMRTRTSGVTQPHRRAVGRLSVTITDANLLSHSAGVERVEGMIGCILHAKMCPQLTQVRSPPTAGHL